MPRLSITVHAFSADQPPSWQPIIDRIRAADRAGVDRVGLSGEHVVFGEHLDAYGRPESGGRAGGMQPTGPDGHFLEPMTTLSVLCGITSRIRLGAFMLAALRRPIVFAKAASTLDVLSGGRLDLGVGVGWQREEYEAAGLDFEARGRLLDHTLEVCQTLWRERRASYSSAELSFDAVHMMPKPVEPGGVPIWVSGTVNPPAMRRLARFGSGWIPWGSGWVPKQDLFGPGGLVEAIPKMRDAVSAYGRDPADLKIVSVLPLVNGPGSDPAIGPSVENVPRLVEAGVTDFYAMLPVPQDPSAAEDYLSEWVGAFRDAAGRQVGAEGLEPPATAL